MSAAIEAARACVAWMANDAEREDRLGDLEEMLGRTDERRYLREAGAVCLSILLRRLRRAFTNGGIDMARIILWAALSVAGVFLFLGLAGGEVLVYVQPFEWGVILAAMVGFAAAGGRLGAWPGILADLRRANRLGGRDRRKQRAVYLREVGDQRRSSTDFAHLDGILQVARDAAPEEADRVMTGGIALFRETSRQRLAVIEQTARDAYAGAAIALVFGIIHTLGNLEEPIMVLGHLMGGALCACFFGLILGRAVLMPVASRLSVLYDQQSREMDALRLSMGHKVQPFPVETFEVLASGLVPQAI